VKLTAALDSALRIPGWTSAPELRWLIKHAATAKTVVEIGASRGRSGKAFADGTDATVFSVDPHAEGTWRDFSRNLKDHIASGKVVPVRLRSEKALPYLPKVVDFIFIDGDHAYDAVHRDIVLYRPLVAVGGILCGHDYTQMPRHAGVRRSVEELFERFAVYGSIWWWRRGA
jgi:predicted O-methyltransferase YrrM